MVLNTFKIMVVDFYADSGFEVLWGYDNTQYPIFAKSRIGFVVTLFNFPKLRKSKLQTDSSLSTLHYEYVALYHSVRDLLPLKSLIKEVIENLGMDN